MSDSGRQSFTDKASSAMKPDGQKTTMEQVGEHLKGMADSVAGTAQPKSQTSKTQNVGDGISNSNQGSLKDSAKKAVGMGDN